MKLFLYYFVLRAVQTLAMTEAGKLAQPTLLGKPEWILAPTVEKARELAARALQLPKDVDINDVEIKFSGPY